MISIEEGAFADNLLTGLIIPNSVLSIGEGAFAHNNLSNLIIPSSLTHIGNYAFANNSLTALSISTGVTSIGEGAFYSNKLTSVVIPESVASIGDDAFARNQAKPEDLTIIAHCQSPARDYAANNGHMFQATHLYNSNDKTNGNVPVGRQLSVISNRSRLARTTGYTFERSEHNLFPQTTLLEINCE